MPGVTQLREAIHQKVFVGVNVKVLVKVLVGV